jgi:DNA-3-methyladenine glycosylase
VSSAENAITPVARSFRLLVRRFFMPQPDVVARALLGKLLIRRLESAGEPLLLSGRIVETEAYFGEGDPAAHAFAGRTPRNSVLWGDPGHAYVYFVYGMHSCLNVACQPSGKAGCVLIRALEPITGLDTMARLRGLEPGYASLMLTGGPGKLCRALDITRAGLNGADLLDPAGQLMLAEDDFEPGPIVVTPRIGISKAAERPLRFLLAGNPCVSGRQSL